MCADSGSIYGEVMKLADGCEYPLSYLSGNYPDTASYVKTVRAKVLELFHYDPGTVSPKAEVEERW